MNLKRLIVALLLSGMTGVGYTQDPGIPTPKQYVAYKTTESIVIDGKADEASWHKAPWSDDFIDIEGVMTPVYKTNIKMLWDERYLYFFARIEEPHVWATLKERDTVIFYNNDFEIFIDPDGDTHNYMEFEMNALNTIWDLFLTKPYRDFGKVLNRWDIKGIKTAVHVEGTLNHPHDVDSGWCVEIAMPWSSITEAANSRTIPVGQFWRINFSRVNWQYEIANDTYSRKRDAGGRFLPEYNWVWSPQWVVNMHEPEKWGYVFFSSEMVGNETAFTVPTDERIKWILYSMYRRQKKHFTNTHRWITSMDSLATEPIILDGKHLTPKLEIHQTGWNLSIRSPFTEKVLYVREDGKFMTLD